MPPTARAAATSAPAAAPTPLAVVPEPMPTSLAAALALLQTRLPAVGKDKTARVSSEKGTYTYTYANLASLSRAAMPLLGALGLSFSAKPTMVEGGRFVLSYTLRHVSGEEDAGEWPLSDPTRVKPQAMGSEITYARRYSFCAITGLVADEDDDDGAAAGAGRDSGSGSGPYHDEPPARPPSGRNWVEEAKALTTEKQVVELGYEASAAGEFTGGVKTYLISRRQQLAAAGRGPA